MANVLISFDFWNTIARPNPAYKETRTAILMDLFGISKEQAEIAHLEVKKVLDKLNRFGVSLTTEQCWDMVIENIKDPVDHGFRRADYMIVTNLMQMAAKQHPPHIQPSFVEWFNNLQTDNIHTAILSNTNMISGVTLSMIMLNAGIRLPISTVFSDERLCSKPSIAMFQHLPLTRFSKPDDVRIHVGDDPINDGFGAIRCKMDFVQVDSPDAVIGNVEAMLEVKGIR